MKNRHTERKILNMPSCFLAACLLLIVAFACNGVAFGASLNVGLGTSQSITSPASYDAATVSGVLNVSNGAVVDLPGKTTLGGSASDYAEINVLGNGTSFGNEAGVESTAYRLGSAEVGTGGTLGRISVGAGAYAEIFSVAFADDAVADPTSGTIDFLNLSGEFRCHDWQVPAGKTVRLRFMGGHLQWGRLWNQAPFNNVRGSLVLEAVDGNPVDLRCYGGGEGYFDHRGGMSVVGTGDAVIRVSSSSVKIYNHQIVYDNDGYVRIEGGATLFSNQYKWYSMFGEHSKGLVLGKGSRLSLTSAMSESNFSPRNVDATNGTISVSDATKSYVWRTGRWNHDGFFRADLPEQITLVKDGTGVTTVDAPSSAGNLRVDAGTMRFESPFSCGTLTIGEGATLEVAAKVTYETLVDNGGTVKILDGGEWTRHVTDDLKERAGSVGQGGAFVKSGTGTLTLFNPVIAAGARLYVTDGTLDFSAIGRTEKYWKLTVNEMNTNYNSTSFCRIGDIVQYAPADEGSEFSSSSNAVNKSLSGSSAVSPDKLAAGTAMFCTPVTYTATAPDYMIGVYKYFEHGFGNNFPLLATPLIDHEDSSTYLVVAWRLADSALPVAGYDLVHAYSCNRPKGWTMECSTNGIDWVTADIQTEASASQPDLSYAGFRTQNSGCSTCAFKLPLTYTSPGATGIAGAIAVGVDGGATLDFSRMAAPVEVDRLVIDAVKGFGSLANVSLSAVGTIEVLNAEGDIANYSFSMELEDVTGLENLASWTVSVNGTPVSRRTPRFAPGGRGGTLFFSRPGFGIIVR